MKTRSSQRGSVTAETAAALPALVVVLVLALWAVTAVCARLECVDAARAGARAAARGDDVASVRAAAARLAPNGATVEITVGPDIARVMVSVEVRPAMGAMLPSIEVSASASAATEPGVTAAQP